jgi:hypothetical protein
MTTQTQKTMLRRWSVVCALFGVTLEKGFTAMKWVKSIHAQRIHIGCGCGCGGDQIGQQILELKGEWDLGSAMLSCRTH